MMTTNLFVIANVKQLRTGGSFRILLPFFQTSWGVGILNSAFLTVFTIGLSLARFWRAFRISGGFEHLKPPPSVCHCFTSPYIQGLRGSFERCSPSHRNQQHFPRLTMVIKFNVSYIFKFCNKALC